MILTFSSSIEASDAQRRIISGVVVPFNQVGNTSVGPVVFESGSIEIPTPSKVKLLAQHSTNDPIGRAQSFQESATEIRGSFKVSASQKGTDYLLLASEDLISGLSVGVEVIASKPGKDGTLYVQSALLKEVSLVESPAFTAATVQSVVAQAAPMGSEDDVVEELLESKEDELLNQISNAVDQMKLLQQVEKALETQENLTETESEAMMSQDTTAATTEAAAAPAADASRPTVKAAAPYITSSVRHGITSAGRYTEHKIKAAMGNEESKLWVAASEDPQYVTAAVDSIGTTNPAFNPIQYMKEFVSNTNFGRPAIDAISRGTLPSNGMSFNVPKLTTAPTVAATAEAAAPSDTGMVSAYITGTVSKYAGQQTVTLELLERSDPLFYDELTLQLQRAYLQATDAAVIAALTSGGTQAATTAATSAGIISFISTEAPAAYAGTSFFAQNYLAGTSQWSLLLGATDSTGRPIYNASSPMNAGGSTAPTSIKGNVLGLDLYVDKNAVSTTIDDSAFIIAPECVTWYESPTSYFSVNIVGNMEVQTAIYGYGSTLVKQAAGIRRFNIA
jgi:HK97 family phage prohead protease/HK97 family phage major capsid protein